ncbi:MAG: phosphonate metabolism transcriptional regulator PhnF [Pseudomonadota bacterium]
MSDATSRPGTLWRRIHDTLSHEIDDGRYPAGAKLPTEAALAERFSVNRHTVRRALEALREAGRIHVRRGAGAFVTQGRFDYAIGPRTRFSANLAELGAAPNRRIIRLETLPADQQEAERLGLAKAAPVIVAENIAEADGVPVIYSRNTYPADRLPGLYGALREVNGITKALAKIGVTDYQRLWTRIVAERPGAMIARHLKMPENHPVLRTESLNADPHGRAVEYAKAWFCSDRIALVVDKSSFG